MKSGAMRRARHAVVLITVPSLLVLAPVYASAETEQVSSRSTNLLEEPEAADVVAVVASDRDEVDRLVSTGVDLTHYRKPVAGGFELHAVVTDSEQDALREQGFDVRATVFGAEEMEAVREEREETVEALEAAAAAQEVDTLEVLRADWFRSVGGRLYINLEVKSSLGEDSETVVTASWGDESITLSRFTDAGEYLYHRTSEPYPLDSAPDFVTFTSSAGGEATAPVTEWLGNPPEAGAPYVATGFIDHYMDPTELTARIEALAAEFPNLAEIIELPYETNGYRRKAQLTVGETPENAFYVTSEEWGHEGGNDISVRVLASVGEAPLSVSVDGNAVTVHLAAGSTATQVVDAINAHAGASALLTATLYRGEEGPGAVQPMEATNLDDNLDAPDSVSHEPFTVKAIRIGTGNDEEQGNKTGVFAYAQEHAREWVTPLVALETAERLLRSYEQDPATRRLVDGLDLFILPVVNPDGAHYSLYDFNGQRKNMTNHCGPEDADPGRRNQWGVDLNRNFTVGSAYDGYVGASTTNCRSGTYAGPAELSEPEAKNEVWLTEEYPNIKFAMNVHSYGGYFMWPPGAYSMPGRVPLPRPTYGEESYFWDASDTILNAVQSYRGTATWPGRTGPVIDVLYSAAGNSADEHWYSRGIFGWDFEVGADLWDPEEQEWDPVGFQPPFEEGYEEAMEFSSGLMGMFEVALAYGQDETAPQSRLVVTDRTATTTTFTFETSEPATVHYTLDGARPTRESAALQNAGLREGAESFTVSNDTVVNWFAVDMPGNIENTYSPGVSGDFYESWVVTAGGTTFDDLFATMEQLDDDDRLAGHVEGSLRDRLDRAYALYQAGSETRTIGYLEQFLARAENQIKGDAGDAAVRDALVAAVQQLIDELREAEEEEENEAA